MKNSLVDLAEFIGKYGARLRAWLAPGRRCISGFSVHSALGHTAVVDVQRGVKRAS
jgi:hypothetical protein